MKTLKITTDNKISIIDLDFDHKSLREEVGGYVELVRTQKLLDYFKTKVVMIVDEEGLVKNLPVNPMGCYFYDTNKHGNPIVGDVILVLYIWICATSHRKEINMEDKKSMEVATDQNEGYEFDEGIEPTPEEIEAAKKLAEQEV